MARDQKISGWHSMRKSELVDAIVAVANSVGRKNRSTKPVSNGNGHRHRPLNGHGQSGRCRLMPTQKPADNGHSVRDRLNAEAIGPNWLHVKWSLTKQMLQRAEAALGPDWHQAVPVLRVFDVDDPAANSASKTWLSDVEINQPLDNWFVPIERPGMTVRLQLGYLATNGRFFSLIRSGKVKTLRAGTFRAMPPTSDQSTGTAGSENGANGVRMNGQSHAASNGHTNGKTDSHHPADVDFVVDAEVTLRGRAFPVGKLTLLNEPIEQTQNGDFIVRFALEEGRHVIPTVYLTPDGSEKRTIILALERNTKQMEPESLNDVP